MYYLLKIIKLLICLKQINSINLSLNGNDWLTSNQNKSIQVSAQVPGSIYTDLIRANVLGQDPYFGNNDFNYRWVSYDNWTFHKYFNVNENILNKRGVFLICHGLDTISTIYLNQRIIGNTDNMFVRYKFDIKSHLRLGSNQIDIRFESAVTYANRAHHIYGVTSNYSIPPESVPAVQRGEDHVNFIRKMQSSFSWDWGPAFPTQGIWKDIEIEAYDSAIIRDITVTTIPRDNNKWSLNTNLYLESIYRTPFEGLVEISIYKTVIYRKLIEFSPSSDGNVNFNSLIDVNDSVVIHKWYPNGIGSQMLYDLNFIVTTTEDILLKSISIGFRTIQLIEDMIKPNGLTFYFQVNGLPFYSKGSNWIPAHVFQEELTSDYIRYLLQSSRDANMNMLRVWGGGVYLPDLFYQIADQMGILIWHDFMFACALYPVDQKFLSSVREEVTQQVRRLQYHPSIAVWAGNNENELAIAGQWWPQIHTYHEIYKRDYIRLYVENIRQIVIENDISRPYLTSSPTNGIQTIKDGWLSDYPQDNRFGDIHFYYYGRDAWNWNQYPSPKFASEYGFQSFPSLKSLMKVVNTSDLTYPLSDAIKQRQHHTNGNKEITELIDNYMKLPIAGGVDRLRDFIYLSQIAQAMSLKTETEFYRRNRRLNHQNGEGFTMGALYWQLNDIWPAPTWSTIEFGGKWKMSHYFIKKTFDNLLVVAFNENNRIKVALIRDDYIGVVIVFLKIRLFKWSALKPTFETTLTANTTSFSSKIIYENMISDLMAAGNCFDLRECVIEVTAHSPQHNWRSNNFLLLSSIRDAIGIKRPNITVSLITGPNNFIPDYIYEILIQTDNIALFVWFDFTDGSDIMGEFSENGFFLFSATKIVSFFSKTPLNANYLRSNLLVKSLTDVKTTITN